MTELHCHSTASDGLLTPAELVRLAVSMGLTTLALTDHDTTEGISAAQEAAPRSLEIWTGVELSCRWRKRNFHLLGYLFEAANAPLQTILIELRQSRQQRLAQMLERLSSLGLELSPPVRERLNSANPGRAHLARALVAEGHCLDLDDAFRRYLGQGKKAYVPGHALEPRQAIEALHGAGGVAVLAHPGLNDAHCLLDELKRAGLDGLEVYYPRHDRLMLERLEREAERLGLLRTGGSDYHGPEPAGQAALGSARLPADTLELLRECSRIKNSNAR